MENKDKSEPMSDLDKKRSHILRMSHVISFVLVILCILAITAPFMFPDNKIAEVFSNLGLAFLSALIVYKFIEMWVDKEYRELRIKEYRSTLLHKDSITNILKEGAVEEILEACLRILFSDNNIALGVRKLLKRYSSELPQSFVNHRESITLSNYDEKYYKLKRVVSYSTDRIPSTITFRCKLMETGEEDRSIILDRTKQESWLFLKYPTDKTLPNEAYNIINMKVDDKKLEPIKSEPSANDTNIEFIFRIPDNYSGQKELHKIKYEMEVLQSKTGGFYAFTNSSPTKGIYLNFQSKINKKIHIIAEGISCINEPDIVEHENSVEIAVEDWVFPNSAVVFAWSETS